MVPAVQTGGLLTAVQVTHCTMHTTVRGAEIVNFVRMVNSILQYLHLLRNIIKGPLHQGILQLQCLQEYSALKPLRHKHVAKGST